MSHAAAPSRQPCMSTTTSALDDLAGQKTVILTTYRRNGTPVDTPVHIAFDGGHAFVRTYDGAYKTGRLRRRPEGELWLASTGSAPVMLGLLRPKAAHRVGRPIHVRAVELSGDAYRRAGAAMGRKYPFLHGFLFPRLHRLFGHRTVHLELTAAS
jgi:uncharacterized protein